MNPKDLKIEPGLLAFDPEAAWKQWQRLIEKQEALADPIGMVAPITNAHAAWLAHPQKLANWMARTARECLTLQAHVARRLTGGMEEDWSLA